MPKGNNCESLEDYYVQFVEPCSDCSGDPNINRFITYEKLPPCIGDRNGSVLILGHSPRVRAKSDITVTLDLNRESNLKNYIVGEILHPLGIKLEQCNATNLVKCKTVDMPEEIKIEDKRTFMKQAFTYCRKHLENEILLYDSKLIISLSERVATLLQGAFRSNMKIATMKEIFATKQNIIVRENKYLWIPVVHIPKAKVRDAYFPEQTNRLQKLRSQINDVL